MAIQCPYCMHLMDVKGAKPGRFTPRCSACKRKFALAIPSDSRQAPAVAALSQEQAAQQTQVGERLPFAIETALGIDPPAAAKTAKPQAAEARATVAPPAPPRPPSLSGSVAATVAAPTVAPRGPIGGGATAAPPSASSAPTAPPTRGGNVTTAPGSAAAPAGADPAPSSADDDELRGTIGGYEIVQRLGRGGMGSVYLARQLSLDRSVALKTLLKELAVDAGFVARFTREAYAAAQLVHHNVVQIYDIGAQDRTHFFSMEFVDGQTLSQLLREQGRLDPEVAVGYVLQAARGLRFAHEHGMVHRDVKPENLLLNRHGIVKVVDLGLVKIPGAIADKQNESARAKEAAATGRWYDSAGGKTEINTTMGTPAYMAPEQAQDAARVDVRADIYSLGCTLYTLLVGRPPFEGRTAVEVITRHLRDAVVPPERYVDTVGPQLSGILMTMLAKRPQDRYQSLAEVIAALEAYLGVESAGPYSPKEDQARALENCVAWFNNAKAAKLRSMLAAAFVPLVGIAITVVLLVVKSPAARIQWVGGLLGFAVLTPLIYLVVSGIRQKTFLMYKVREFIASARLVDWLLALVGLALVVATLVALELHWAWLAFAAVAAFVGVGFHFALDAAVEDERLEPVARAQTILKAIRSRGVSEAAVQQFVCKYAGEHWEGFFEALFGYEAKIRAREKWAKSPDALERKGSGDKGRPRPKHGAWREPIIAWLDAKIAARRESRERRHLEQIEIANLKAKGIIEAMARKKARRLAESMVMKAAELRASAIHQAMETAPLPPPASRTEAKPDEPKPEEPPRDGSGSELRRKPRRVFEDEGLEGFEHLSYFQRRYGGWPGFFLGPPVRFVLGAVLLAGCLLWAKQNNLLSPRTAAELAAAEPTVEVVAPDRFATARGTTPAAPAETATTAAARVTRKPLELKFVPAGFARLFDNWVPGVAGLLLIVSAFSQGPMLGLFVVPGALVMFLGPRFIPSAGSLASYQVSALIGIVPVAIGLIVARK